MLNGTWNAESQIIDHDPRIATRPELGMSPFNIPEGFFVYAKGTQIKGQRSAAEIEYACDLNLQKVMNGDVIVGVVCYGVQFMCPRCAMGLFIPAVISKAQREAMDVATVKDGKAAPPVSDNARPVHIHWDKMTQSSIDKKFRPTITIEGSIACDYSMHEINGIAQPAGNILNRCGWVGVLEEGRLYDHVKQSNIIVAASG